MTNPLPIRVHTSEQLACASGVAHDAVYRTVMTRPPEGWADSMGDRAMEDRHEVAHRCVDAFFWGTGQLHGKAVAEHWNLMVATMHALQLWWDAGAKGSYFDYMATYEGHPELKVALNSISFAAPRRAQQASRTDPEIPLPDPFDEADPTPSTSTLTRKWDQ